MGCMYNIKIQDQKYTSIIVSNQLIHEVKEKRKYSQPLNQHIFSKKHFEENPNENISQTAKNIIENNPLPFVKIKRKRNVL